ncbi:MAG: DUF4440 domain-containing protein [Bacteroidales bacterium]
MKSFRIVVLFIVTSFVTLTSFAQGQKDFMEIKNLMKAQEIAWNQGDIPAYMQYYWQSDSMLFVSKKGVTKGWQQTLDHYLKSYPDKQIMGTLTFDHLSFQFIDNNNMIIIGSWQLIRDKGDVGGYFSLLWRKIKGKWKIIIDHTS